MYGAKPVLSKKRAGIILVTCPHAKARREILIYLQMEKIALYPKQQYFLSLFQVYPGAVFTTMMLGFTNVAINI